MKTLTEKVNGQREWSVYGLHEIQRIKADEEDDLMILIVISNALSECGLNATKHDSRKFWLSKDLFVKATLKGILIGKDSCGVDDDEIILETVKDPTILFERIRVIWGNRYP